MAIKEEVRADGIGRYPTGSVRYWKLVMIGHKRREQIMGFFVMKIGRTLGMLLLLSLIGGCGSDDTSSKEPADRQAQLAAKLQKVLVAAITDQRWLPGVAAAVDWPFTGLHWSGAAGVGNVQSGVVLRPEFSFRTASVTKTFLAAAVHRVVEQGKVSLEDSLDQLLAEAERTLLKNYGYRVDRITVAQLLAHTSGLPDYAESQQYIEAVLADPTRRWTRYEQLAFALKNFMRKGEPGQVFSYSDTGYLLLGEIVERWGGLSLADTYRHVLNFAQLGLSSTWLESLEPIPPGAGPRMSQYLNDLDITTADPSFDLYGGGGLVSTVVDLNRFISALFDKRVVSAASLNSMMTVTLEPHAGRGLLKYNLDGVDCWGHEGYWGVLMLLRQFWISGSA